MKKKIISTILTLVILISLFPSIISVPASAAVGQTFIVNGVTYYILSEDATTGTVQVGIGSSSSQAVAQTMTGTLTIPNTVSANSKTYTVVGIGAYAFYNCSLTGINLSAATSVKTISYYAFFNCISLINVSLPTSVTTIGSYAFYNCTSLTSILIPATVTTIDSYAFRSCTKLTNVTLGANLTAINDFAFSFCTALQNITIPAGVTSIRPGAFAGSTNLTVINVGSNPNFYAVNGILYNSTRTVLHSYPSASGNIPILSTVTKIDDYAFAYAPLTGVTIHGDITHIGNNAFYNCTRLTAVMVPPNVTFFGSYAFYNCTSMTSAVINSNSDIGSYAFYNCINLSGVTISDTQRTINHEAFANCISLLSIYIPKSVKFQNGSIFAASANLAAINVDASNPWYLSEGPIVYNKERTQIVCYPYVGAIYTIPSYITSIGDYAFYRSAKLTNVTVPGNVTTIGNNAFQSSPYLQTANLQSGVQYIGNYAFANCGNLTTVTIPGSAASTGEYTFQSCYNLINITIQNGVTAIGNGSFYNCNTLSSLTLPVSLTTIGSYAFGNCTAMPGITIPASVTTIGSSAFYYCTALTGVTIPNSVTTIGSSAFYYCTALTGITIPNSVTSIGSGAFYNSGLQSITIPSSVISCDYAFQYCQNLKTVTFQDGVSNIGNGMFYFCTTLTDITIPGSVMSIGNYAFYNCTVLKTVTLRDGVARINPMAFYNCTALANIYIPDSTAFISSDAFINCPAAFTINSCVAAYARTFANTNGIRWVEHNTCQFNVKFVDWNGRELKTLTVSHGSSAVPPENPTRIHYTFLGWDVTYSNVNSDLTVTACYTINYYDVIFVDWDGEVLKTESVAFGSAATPPGDPSRYGYTFNGWDPEDFTVTTDADLIVTAHYTVNYYDVVFMDWDGEVLKTESVAFGSAATPPPTPARTGYTFTGWDPADFSITTEDDLVVTAQYEINYYDVTFLDWDGSVLSRQSVVYLGAAEAPVDPVRKDHYFIGWDTDFSCIPAYNLTVTAQYVPWLAADKNDAYGVQIPSNSHSYDAGSGVVFYWDQKQKDNGVLEIASMFFETYKSVTIVVKSSNEYRKITVPISGSFEVNKWVDEKGKEHNINMIWVRFNG